MSLEVRPAAGPQELDAAIELRREVFVGEQGVSEADEFDGREEECVHVIAVDGGRVVGCCRLLPAGERVKLGRMVVASGRRREGIAAAMLAEADRQAAALGATLITLSAQTYVVSLYEQAGYEVTSGTFDEVGIEHVRMEKRLP
ncbi:MAG: GNAT family N-acetyltransferase [Solirubrobacteraceae bacterium]|nr:GNAT family N-acetyltransferase [Solirubrobacteraceae bacterium]